MPNHISNRLTITGEVSDVTKVFAEIANEDTAIDFSKIIPRPPIFDNTASGYHTFDGKEVRTWWTDTKRWNDPDKLPDRAFTDEEAAELSASGFSSWYDWNIAHWGTKWNAYSTRPLDDTSIYFQTAWSAPIKVITALAKLHPEVGFKLEYADEDKGSNAGVCVFRDEFVDIQVLNRYNAVRLWFRLNGGDPAEYGYDPVTFEYVEE